MPAWRHRAAGAADPAARLSSIEAAVPGRSRQPIGAPRPLEESISSGNPILAPCRGIGICACRDTRSQEPGAVHMGGEPGRFGDLV